MSPHQVQRLAFSFLVLAAGLAAQPPVLQKVMITEVCPYDTEAVELVNFGVAAADLSAFTVKWRFNDTTFTSQPLGIQLAPGQIIVVRDVNGGGTNLNVPGHVGQILYLPPITVPFGSSVTVALVNGAGAVTDEVRILGLAPGATSQGSLGGTFRGMAELGPVASGPTSAERIWGLDSDSAGDWCRAIHQTIGRENTGSGPRTADTFPVPAVVINEVDARQPLIISAYHTVELQNRSGTTVNLFGWFLLVSGAQGAPLARIEPWPVLTFLSPGAFMVLVSSNSIGTLPAEMPAGTPYRFLDPGTGTLPLGNSNEYTVALYDNYGRLVDLVRATARGTEVVHNHPRAPSAWNDFRGAARRPATNASGIGRTPGAADTNSAADWRPTLVRTMGLPNTLFSDGPGDGASPDVRLDETVEGQGMTLIVNAGPQLAGAHYYLLFSTTRANGMGPILGLALNSLDFFAAFTLSGIPPLQATLDAEGSCRFDIPRASLPSGLQTDNIVIIQGPVSPSLPHGAILTKVLEFDT